MTALQKPTQESVIASIVRVQFHHWEDTQFVSCLVERDDGFRAHGFHNPIDAADFNLEESQRLAYAGAVATLYGLAVSGFFERRAMLAGAHDVLDRCGVGSEDVSAPRFGVVMPDADTQDLYDRFTAVLDKSQPLPEWPPVTQEQREELRRLMGGHLVDKVAPAGPFEYPETPYVQVKNGTLTVNSYFCGKPSGEVGPAVGSGVIVRMPESFKYPKGAEVVGVVKRGPQCPGSMGVEIAIDSPGRFSAATSIYANQWSQLDLVERPFTEAEGIRLGVIRASLEAEGVWRALP